MFTGGPSAGTALAATVVRMSDHTPDLYLAQTGFDVEDDVADWEDDDLDFESDDDDDSEWEIEGERAREG